MAEKSGCNVPKRSIEPQSKARAASKSAALPSSAYSGCKRLSSVTLPEGLVKICDGAFSDTSLTSLVIPSTVMEMGTWAFFCHKLAKVTLPARFNDPMVLVDVFDNSSTKLFGTSEATLLQGFTFK